MSDNNQSFRGSHQICLFLLTVMFVSLHAFEPNFFVVYIGSCILSLCTDINTTILMQITITAATKILKYLSWNLYNNGRLTPKRIVEIIEVQRICLTSLNRSGRFLSMKALTLVIVERNMSYII